MNNKPLATFITQGSAKALFVSFFYGIAATPFPTPLPCLLADKIVHWKTDIWWNFSHKAQLTLQPIHPHILLQYSIGRVSKSMEEDCGAIANIISLTYGRDTSTDYHELSAGYTLLNRQRNIDAPYRTVHFSHLFVLNVCRFGHPTEAWLYSGRGNLAGPLPSYKSSFLFIYPWVNLCAG